MPSDHPDRLIGFEVTTTVHMKLETWRNREDSQGGPGYYPNSIPLASKTTQVKENELPAVLNVKL